MPTSSTDILAALLPAETASPQETQALGLRLGAVLGPGDVVALYGDLGTGKTCLVKGIAAAHDVPPETVGSPTFTLANVYPGRDGPLYHLDAYRLRHLDELFELGIDEYLYGDGLCLVEWPQRLEPLLPEHTLRLHLTHLGRDRRRIAWNDR
ncbi:tRNA (adenosine(37)-N6)-threonylcarbamoyltransferase complex ATPase subunit type 1 TsaE [Rhodocaloribacter litoris]|uniref:tRNA (adenosine(37)-N6)-threonylcarbamoyltransferase complex ATPase subunit type 1 TsaE n=1 Tax=Rhodocaloribacter litoris TaxID=2558931 RepID=UPI001E5AFE66|nr:tRNA (adenosine(37)-N6)-threonylcarbamoyltransferase complex ATPase subunit type 1 TsaE [Rhodocaloribacter litoris]QXD13860.1 tRNA (adenosine(37)-N6)-threonylcarbamoyltransferase complex ATPase subunit type 1 TsaE [Rhodocaloribacter litoris]